MPLKTKILKPIILYIRCSTSQVIVYHPSYHSLQTIIPHRLLLPLPQRHYKISHANFLDHFHFRSPWEFPASQSLVLLFPCRRSRWTISVGGRWDGQQEGSHPEIPMKRNGVENQFRLRVTDWIFLVLVVVDGIDDL